MIIADLRRELEETNATMQGHIESHAAEKASLLDTIKQHEETIEKKEAAIAKLKAQAEGLNEQIAQLRKALKGKEEEVRSTHSFFHKHSHVQHSTSHSCAEFPC